MKMKTQLTPSPAECSSRLIREAPAVNIGNWIIRIWGGEQVSHSD